MEYTEKFVFKMPEGSDNVSIADINGNFRIIDEKVNPAFIKRTGNIFDEIKAKSGVASGLLISGGNAQNTVNASMYGCMLVVGYGNSMAGDIDNAFIFGYQNSMEDGSHSAIIGGMCNSIEEATNAAIVAGRYATAATYQFITGHFNQAAAAGNSLGTTGTAFVIGNGTNLARSNAFRVAYDGNAYGKAAWNSTGADYAEYFEWADGNPDGEDRAGLFVVLAGDKIRPAAEGETPFGIISAAPAVVGDNYDEEWHGKYLQDVFGRVRMQTVELPEETDADGHIITPAQTACVPVLNPDWDPNAVYIPRASRPEWSAVGVIGKLVLCDDGSCAAGGYAIPGADGTATAADGGAVRVLKRLDAGHVLVWMGGAPI